MMKKTLLVTCIATALLIQGCGKKDPEQHLQDALKFVAKNELPAAVIELKSGIQQTPEAGALRYELGLIYLRTGNASSASKELERAMENGVSAEKVAIPLIQSYFLQGQHQKVAAFAQKQDRLAPAIKDVLNLYQALALIDAADTTNAKLLLNELLTSAEPSVKTMAEVQFQVMAGQHAEALVKLESIKAGQPVYSEVVLLSAKLHNVLKEYDQSIEKFKEYLDLNPGGHLARLLLAQTYIIQNKYDEADQQAQILLKLFPRQPLANYLKAVVEFEHKNFQKAKEHSEVAIDGGLNSVSSRVLAALAATQLKLNKQALNHLEQVKTELGAFPPAQKLYVALQLQAGHTDAAHQQLLANENAAADLDLVSATAFQLLKQRSDGAAQELITKYEKSAEKSSNDLLTLGSLKLNVPGMEQQGLSILEQAAKQSPDVEQAQTLLASAYIEQGQYDKAIALATTWLSNEKLKISGYNMLSYVAFLQGDQENAAAYIAKAVAAGSEHPFTLLLQASFAQANNQTPEANKLLIQILDKNPNYLPALEQLYAINREAKDDLALNKAKALIKAEPQNYAAAVLYANMLSDQGDFKGALAVLSATEQPANQRSNLHWALLIENQRDEQKDSAGAVTLAEQWYSLNSADANSVYTYIRTLILNKQIEKALHVTQDELTKRPADLPLIGTQVQLLAELQRYKEALNIIAQLPAAERQKADVLVVKGRILLADKQYEAALVALNESYQQTQASITALMIADTYAKTVSDDKAKAFIEQHFQYKPNDPALQIYYGNLLLKSDKAQSSSMYAKVLETQPDNVAALNNLAWTLMDQKQSAQALPHIEKAIKLAPDNPDVLDTYGSVLFAAGQFEQAAKQFEKSLQQRPDHPLVQLNYAEVLIKNGDKAKAERLLKNLKLTEPEQEKRKVDLLAVLSGKS